MRYLITTLIIAFGLSSCKDKGQSDLRAVEVQNYLKDVKKTREFKFDNSVFSGTTQIFSNVDSSVTRVLVEYDGEYGRGQNELLIVDNRLIYQRDSIIFSVFGSSSAKYTLQEAIYYFNKDSTGTMTSKEVYSETMEFDEDKKNELRNKTSDNVLITNKADYIRRVEELKKPPGRIIRD